MSSKKSTPTIPPIAPAVAAEESPKPILLPTPDADITVKVVPVIPQYITTPHPSIKALTLEEECALLVSARFKNDKYPELVRINTTFYPKDEQVKAVQVGVGLGGADVSGKWNTRTVAKLILWQRAHRFLASGKLLDEQLEHFLNPAFLGVPATASPAPLVTDCAAGMYDHVTEPGPNCGAWPVIDSQLEEVTSTKTWLAGMVRLVSGRKTSHMRGYHYSRGLDSVITLDTYSVGIAHWWAGTAPEQLFDKLARKLPREVVDAAWGIQGSALLTDEKRLKKITGTETGMRRYNPTRLEWLIAGWRAVARRPDAVAIQIEAWVADYIDEARQVAREFDVPLKGRSGGLLLAALARMCNTGPSSCRAIMRKYYNVSKGDEGAAVACMRDIFSIDREKGGYSKKGNGPRRWAIIEATCRVAPSAAILEGRYNDAVAGDLKLDATPTPARGYVRGGQD